MIKVNLAIPDDICIDETKVYCRICQRNGPIRLVEAYNSRSLWYCIRCKVSFIHYHEEVEGLNL